MDAIERNGLFQAIDELSMIKIDFHVGEKIPGELSAAIVREIIPGLMAPLVSKEDAILSKLLWIQTGSHKSRHDVIEMLKRDEDLDRARPRGTCHDPGASTISGGDRTRYEWARNAGLTAGTD